MIVHISRLPLLLGLSLAIPCCTPGVDGNGKRSTETRSERDFTGVDNETSLALDVRRGAEFSVMVSIDSNLQALVGTRVAGDRLVLDVEQPIGDTVSGPHVTVTMPSLTFAGLYGSGSVTAHAFQQSDPVELVLEGSGALAFDGDVTDATARLDGSGDLRLAGSAANLYVQLDGSGQLAGRDFVAGTADLSLGGSGSLSATVTGSARLSLTGSGDIDIYGGGALTRLSQSGSGDVRVH